MSNDYEFTGQTHGDESADFDGSASIPQHSCSPIPTDPAPLNEKYTDEASRAVRAECAQCFRRQGGFSRENRMDELHERTPAQTMAEDLNEETYRNDMYPTQGEWETRRWRETDNVSPNRPDDDFGIHMIR